MDIGVVLQTTPPAARVIDLAKKAEMYGMTHVWTFDSHILWQEPYIRREAQLQALVTSLQQQQPFGSTAAVERQRSTPAPLIQKLTFGHFLSRHLQENTMLDLIKMCGLTLRQLNLSNCPQITNRALEVIGRECRILETLSVEDRAEKPRFSADALCKVFQSCGKLRDIGLYHCANANDELIVIMSQCCPNLRRLALVDNGKLGHRSICAILVNCQKITQIYITSREMQETDELRELAKRCRRVYVSIMEQQRPADDDLLRDTGLKRIKHCRLLKNVSNDALTVERADFQRINSDANIQLFS